MKFHIKHRWNGDVMFECELSAEIAGAEYCAQLGFVVRKAVEAKASLDGANLDVANLDGASLYGASLDGASLYGANLYGANLDGASLARANLARANLYGANLDGASLYGANLDGASLTRASLARAKSDFFRILDEAPNEVPGLLAALREGRIDGSTYQGECACLVGTIANLRGLPYGELGTIKPDSSRPAERWFMAIREGHAPENSQPAKITEGWILEWMRAHESANAGEAQS